MRLVVSNRQKQMGRDERAFLLQLAALNTAIESARADQPSFAKSAIAVDKLLERYFHSITSERNVI